MNYVIYRRLSVGRTNTTRDNLDFRNFHHFNKEKVEIE